MNKYKGLYSDHFLECEAETEQEAQEKMKQMLLTQIQEDDSPVMVWCEGEVDKVNKIAREIKLGLSTTDYLKVSKEWVDQATANSTFINWRWNEEQFSPDKGYDPAIHGTSNYDILKAFIEMQQANKK